MVIIPVGMVLSSRLVAGMHVELQVNGRVAEEWQDAHTYRAYAWKE